MRISVIHNISFVRCIRENANDSRRYHLFIWKCSFIYCITKQIAYTICMHCIPMQRIQTQTYIVCICVCAFVAATCEKFTSMCNSNRVYDLCAICMFKRNSNQIIALLVRTFIKLFYFSVGIMLTKRYEFFFTCIYRCVSLLFPILTTIKIQFQMKLDPTSVNRFNEVERYGRCILISATNRLCYRGYIIIHIFIYFRCN